MVMETPSPQCVGREFVRQYYTLLHEAPEYLHRFYSHNSSFVHGGVEKPGEEQPPVMGQAEIHKKIISLNFRDCHAKIRQVDSQATVGNAVVVQVTGELSNSGQDMRRFMQTFVLAPQSPKKYYVHNDIFRYQDEVFHEDGETEIQDEAVDLESENVETSSQPDAVPDSAVASFYESPPPQPLSNGSAHMEDRAESPVDKATPEPEKIDEPEPVAEPVPMEPKTPEPETEAQTPVEAPKASGGFTWAALLSKNEGPSSAGMSRPEAVVKTQPVKSDMKPMDGGGPPGGPQPQRAPRPPRGERREQQRDGSRSGGEGDDFTRRSRYPDSQQLFVGNLPHTINELELKKYFENYGKVQEVRINRKSINRDVPNFGFVVFEEAETVQKVLDAKPIMLKGEHRLNVEEKKQRSEQGGRPGSGTRTGRGGMGSMGPGRGGGPPGRGGGRGGMGTRDQRPDARGGPPGGGRGGFGPRR